MFQLTILYLTINLGIMFSTFWELNIKLPGIISKIDINVSDVNFQIRFASFLKVNLSINDLKDQKICLLSYK